MTSKTPWLIALPITLLLLSPAAGQPTEKPSKPRKVTLDSGITLHYVERGKGEPIIFIHGLAGDYRVGEQWLAEFTSEYRVIAYSRRYNYPNDNKLNKDHSAVVEAEDLAAFVKKLDLDKVHLVGHSYGAYTALIYTLKHPERVRTVTLADPPVFSWLGDLPGDRGKEGKAIYEWCEDQRRLGREALQAGARKKAFSYFPVGLTDETPPPRRKQIEDSARECEAIFLTTDIYPKVDREKVKEMKTPTLLLTGSKVKEATEKAPRGLWLVIEKLEQLIPKGNYKRAVIAGAEHVMWLTHPKESNQAILEFLKGK